MVATTFMEPAEAERPRHCRVAWVLRGIGVLVVWSAWAFLVGAVAAPDRATAGQAAGPAVAVAAMLVALVPTWFLVRAARSRAVAPGRRGRWSWSAVGLFLGSLGRPEPGAG